MVSIFLKVKLRVSAKAIKSKMQVFNPVGFACDGKVSINLQWCCIVRWKRRVGCHHCNSGSGGHDGGGAYRQSACEVISRRTKHWTLRDALGQRTGGGCAVVDADYLLSDCEIWPKSVGGNASDDKGGFQMEEKNGVVEYDDSCIEVEGDEVTRARGEEEVRGGFEEAVSVLCCRL